MKNTVLFRNISAGMFFLLALLCFAVVLSHYSAPGLPLLHDSHIAISRFVSYHNAHREGIVIPRWSSVEQHGFGVPSFVFFYPVPHIAESLLMFLRLDGQEAYKTLVMAVVVLSPLCFFFWIRRHVSFPAAIVASIVFGLYPSHMLNILVRGPIGEIMATPLIPLIMWGTDRIVEKTTARRIVVEGLLIALLITTHTISTIMAIPVLVGYALVRSKNIHQVISFIFSVCMGVGVSSFLWIPAFLEKKFVMADVLMAQAFETYMVRFSRLVMVPWFVNESHGQIVQTVDGILFLLVLYAVYIVRTQKKYRMTVGYWILVMAGSTFLMTSASIWLWRFVPLLHLVHIPWRFMVIISFAGAAVTGYVLDTIQKQAVVYGIGCILLLSFMPSIAVYGYVETPYDYFETNQDLTFDFGEALPVWRNTATDVPQSSPVVVSSGTGVVSDYVRKTHSHRFTVESDGPVRVVDNTQYFPGWHVSIDGQETTFRFQDPENYGLLVYDVPYGRHGVDVIFTDTPVRKAGAYGTVISLIIAGAMLYTNSYGTARRTK